MVGVGEEVTVEIVEVDMVRERVAVCLKGNQDEPGRPGASV